MERIRTSLRDLVRTALRQGARRGGSFVILDAHDPVPGQKRRLDRIMHPRGRKKRKTKEKPQSTS